MFRVPTRRTVLGRGFDILELIYHSTVRSIRRQHSNAMVGLLTNILQTVVLIAAFYVTMTLVGLQRMSIRGDFVLYLMTGVFLYLTNTKAMGAVFGSEGPTSPMMKHAPMNTLIAISSAALGALYIQVLSAVAVLYIYHVAFTPIEIEDSVGVLAMLLLSWFYGISVGMVFLALKPWWPGLAAILSTIYSRVNMIASGKMFVANTLNFVILKMFDWNPLFHIIDQARGYAFLNYNPHYTSAPYALVVSLVLVTLGLLGEFYTRRRASISWEARR